MGHCVSSCRRIPHDHSKVRTGVSRRMLRKPGRGITLLSMAILLAVVDVWPLLDLGFDPTAPDHMEQPDGSPAYHHIAHDHGLCGVMATVHVVPVARPRIQLPTYALQSMLPVLTVELPGIQAFSVHRSRAPPSV